MRWKIQLDGQEKGLEQLSESFDEDPRIFEENEEYYLWSPMFGEINKSGDIWDLGETIVRLIRNLAEFDSIRVDDLKISRVIEIQEDGSENRIVHASGSVTATAMMSATASVNGEEPPPKAESTYEFTKLALNDPEVEELIELRERGNHWVNLYRIYEYIRDNIGSNDSIVSQGWWTEIQKSRFTCTANDSEAIGHEARHAGEGHYRGCAEEMSHDQMSHNEAKLLIDDLIKSWLRYRAENLESSGQKS